LSKKENLLSENAPPNIANAFMSLQTAMRKRHISDASSKAKSILNRMSEGLLTNMKGSLMAPKAATSGGDVSIIARQAEDS